MNAYTEREPAEGEVCTCGRPAVTVYVVTDDDGTRDVPYCGIPDGGQR